MHNQLFSNKTRGFYPIKNLRYYKSVNAIPDDLVRVRDTEHAKFIGAAPLNCVPNYNTKNKQMEWLSVPLTAKIQEETITTNRAELLRRQRAAAIMAFPLQSAVDLGTANNEVKEKLNGLKRYVVALIAVDLDAPDWPAIPAWIEN